jgi:hypothetical protein
MTTATYTIWETRCYECGATVLTDEHLGGEPYCHTCTECGSGEIGEWAISDETHPALWQH